MVNLHLLALVPETPCNVILALWFDIKRTQTNKHTAHKGTDRLTVKYIFDDYIQWD